MAYQTASIRIGTIVAGANLASSQFCFVKLNSSGKAILASANGEGVIGVLQNKPAADQACDILVIGVTKVRAGAAITMGAQIMTNTAAKAVTAATTGSAVVGFAMETAEAADEFVTAYVNCGADIV